MSPRKWTPWEQRMIGEWVSATFPDVRWQTNVRLGKIQPRAPNGTYTADELRLLGVWRRFVDAIVYLPGKLLLVEAVLRADPGKLAQLDLYETLIPHTPELEAYKGYEIQKVLLFCIEDPYVSALARDRGVLPLLFVPSFFDEWFAKLRARDRRAPQAGI